MTYEDELLSLSRSQLLLAIIDDVTNYNFFYKASASKANQNAFIDKMIQFSYSKNLTELRKNLKLLYSDQSIKQDFVSRLSFFEHVVKRKQRGKTLNRIMHVFNRR